MQKLKRTGITTLVLLGLFVSSGVALAETAETEVIEEEATDTELVMDTLFSFGYDLINGLFLWNISSIDEPCALPTAEEAESETEPESDPDPDCELTEGEVAGPEGQVNHGMFMKLFNSLYEGTGRGCVVRHLAQSDLGMGDQQVEVDGEGEAETDPEVAVSDVDEAVDFTTIETVCQHGPGNGDVLDSEDDGTGKPAWAGKPEGVGKPDSPGKPEGVGKPGSPDEDE
ncbi:MAG: hypothetical protein WDZ96_00730 [Acidimicrobiia bacterium]